MYMYTSMYCTCTIHVQYMYIVLHAYISRYISLQEDVTKVEVHADDGIIFQLLSGKDDFVGENKFDMSLLQATGGTGGSVQQQDKGSSKLNKVVTHEYTYTHMYMYVCTELNDS